MNEHYDDTFMTNTDLYIGNCLFQGNVQKEMNRSIINKMSSKLKGWKSKLLSRAGRTVFVNSTLASIPIFTMSTNQLPKHVCKYLDGIQRNF